MRPHPSPPPRCGGGSPVPSPASGGGLGWGWNVLGRAFAAILLCAFTSAAAAAGIPADYSPMVIEPKVKDGRTEFDLTAAQGRAKREQKRLYVYLGAIDCPYCRLYETFLRENAHELTQEF